MTNEEIVKRLADIEQEYNVRVLYAVESGSRAWGFASPDSDWDVRFIYVHPLEWYLTVVPGRDVIEVTTDDGFDAAGWDIRKTLLLFKRQNPSLLEWVRSPIIYIDKEGLRAALLELEPIYFNAKRAIYHYYHVATNHQNRYLEKRGVELKRFLYYFRSLLACKWIMQMNTPPPVPFELLVAEMIEEEEIRKEIARILSLKSQNREHDKEKIPHRLEDYGHSLESTIIKEMANFDVEKTTQPDNNHLDKLLVKLINR